MKIAGVIWSWRIFFVAVVAIVSSKAGSFGQDVKIDSCLQDMDYHESLSCSDVNELRLTCLKKIDPIDDFDAMELENVIKYEERKQGSCAQEETTSKCVDKVVQTCMKTFRKELSFHSGDVCDEIESAKICLDTINKTCDSDVVSREMATLNNTLHQCTSGLYDKKSPCNANKIFECTEGVLYIELHDNKDKMFMSCEKPDVDGARLCLMDMKNKCTTPHQQDEISKLFYQIEHKCRS